MIFRCLKFESVVNVPKRKIASIYLCIRKESGTFLYVFINLFIFMPMKVTKESLKRIFSFVLKLMNVLAEVFGLRTTDKQP